MTSPPGLVRNVTSAYAGRAPKDGGAPPNTPPTFYRYSTGPKSLQMHRSAAAAPAIDLQKARLRAFRHGASRTRTDDLLGAIQALAGYAGPGFYPRDDAALMAADWRTEWRTSVKLPANQQIRDGLESR
jgi:hypothetical protein